MGERRQGNQQDNSLPGDDPRMIDLENPSERAYWCKCFGITPEQLITLVRTLGPSAQKIKDSVNSGFQNV